MDAFSYLSVLLSIILGLAIQQVLQGYRALILSRRRIHFYPLPLIWSVLLLIIVVQHWWASFGLADRAEWSFADFATTLVLTSLIYMLSAVVLPDVPENEPLDLEAHYYREAQAFFLLLGAAVGWSLLRELMLEERLPERDNLLFHLLFLTVAALGIATRRERVHQAIAAVMSAALLAYVVLLFMRLDR
jgi:hypothetical protein